MEGICGNYTDDLSCYLDKHCDWCLNPGKNYSVCYGEYKCYEIGDCYSRENGLCDIINGFNSVTIIAGLITSSILLFSGLISCLKRSRLFNYDLSRIWVIVCILLALPIICSFFFYSNHFFIIFMCYLSGCLFLNLSLYR
jgi:hypothetical protein